MTKPEWVDASLVNVDDGSGDEYWRPEVGEELLGTVKGYRDWLDSDGKDVVSLLIEDEHEVVFEVALWYKQMSALVTKAAKDFGHGERLKAGTLIWLLRAQDRKSKAGRTYRFYKVAVKEGDAPAAEGPVLPDMPF